MQKKKVLTAEQLEDAKRLRALYESRKKEVDVTQQSIADALNISQGAVGHYLNGRNALNPKVASVFAKMLKISISDFSSSLAKETMSMAASEKPEGNNQHDPLPVRSGFRSVPLLSRGQAARWNAASGLKSLSGTIEFLQTNLPLSSSAFAFAIDDDSMIPEFNEGDIVICDPQTTRVPGDFVITQIDNAEEISFRRFRLLESGVAGERFEIFPLNDVYPSNKSNGSEIRIVGTMVEHRRYRQNPKR